MLLLLLSRFSRVRLCATPETAAHQAPCPWDSPGKNTGEGCHFLLQCMKVKSEREVAQSCPTRSNPMDCSLPGSSIHGIFQARVLEWGAIAFSEEHLQDSAKGCKVKSAKGKGTRVGVQRKPGSSFQQPSSSGATQDMLVSTCNELLPHVSCTRTAHLHPMPRVRIDVNLYVPSALVSWRR